MGGLWLACEPTARPSKMINALEKDGVLWTITADKNQVVMALIHRINERARMPVTLSGSGEALEKPYYGGGYVLCEEKTPEAFLMLVKREGRSASTPPCSGT
ncbi:MAG: hypothetical protein ACYCRD_08065 [Leptospirillum sp.]